MHRVSRTLAAASLFVVCCVVAGAASALRAVDYGDVWWNPNESGWGMQIADQGDMLFLTFYVYDSDHHPTWFTALATFQSTNAAGARVYSGSLFANTGPYYGGTFNPANVVTRTAGTATFTADSSTTATLSYTVDNVTVTKSIQRLPFNLMNLSGTGYIGSFIEIDQGCTNPLLNTAIAASGTFNVVHNPPATQVTITTALSANVIGAFTCTFQGTYSQLGRYGAISAGTYSCSNGNAGTFTAHDIELTSQGILGRYDTVSSAPLTQGCRATGGFGGLLPS